MRHSMSCRKRLKTLLGLEMHGQHLVSGVACRNVRKRLTENASHHMIFHCYPSHERVPWIQLMDEDAKEEADLFMELTTALSHKRSTCLWCSFRRRAQSTVVEERVSWGVSRD